MKSASDVTALVLDHGLFLPVARDLARHYGKVYYWTPTECVLPRIQSGIVGDGFPDIERVMDFHTVKDQCDLFVFPDIGFAGLQHELRRQGQKVWGHNGGDILEVSRGQFLSHLENLGMDVTPYMKITGLTALREHLRDEQDKWIKISKWRGDWETLHWRSWEQDEVTLDQYAYHLGPAKELITFYVFDPIDTDIEDGIDTYCIDGRFPSLVLHGMEKKDKSYLCAVQELDSIHESVREATGKFAPVLAGFGYRGFFTSEVRLKDDQSYFIDPTCRAASPASQVMGDLFGNLGEIIWQGANGFCIDPDPTARFGAQVLIACERDKDEWVVLDIPDSIKDRVKCGFACEIDGRLCIPPHPLEHMVGWLCATGDSIVEVIENLQEYAMELPDGVCCDVQSMSSLLEEAQDAKEEGVVIADRIPKPDVVL